VAPERVAEWRLAADARYLADTHKDTEAACTIQRAVRARRGRGVVRGVRAAWASELRRARAAASAAEDMGNELAGEVYAHMQNVERARAASAIQTAVRGRYSQQALHALHGAHASLLTAERRGGEEARAANTIQTAARGRRARQALRTAGRSHAELQATVSQIAQDVAAGASAGEARGADQRRRQPTGMADGAICVFPGVSQAAFYERFPAALPCENLQLLPRRQLPC
jgi:hypothetical protein